MFQHVGWICMDAKGASSLQFGLALATREKTHRERSCANRGEHAPNAIANNSAVLQCDLNRSAEATNTSGGRLALATPSPVITADLADMRSVRRSFFCAGLSFLMVLSAPGMR